jgi:hypothetical protein
MPALTRLERMVLDAGYDIHQGSFDELCERFRERLRREIALVREGVRTGPCESRHVEGEESQPLSSRGRKFG